MIPFALRAGALAARSQGFRRYAAKAAGLGSTIVKDVLISTASMSLWEYIMGGVEGASENATSNEALVTGKGYTVGAEEAYTDFNEASECQDLMGWFAFLDYTLGMSPNLATDLRIIDEFYERTGVDMLKKGLLSRLRKAVLSTGGFGTSTASSAMLNGSSLFQNDASLSVNIPKMFAKVTSSMTTNLWPFSSAQLIRGTSEAKWGDMPYRTFAAAEVEYSNANEFKSDDATGPNSYSEIRGEQAKKGSSLLEALKKALDFGDMINTKIGECRDIYGYISPLLKRFLDNYGS